MADFALVQSTGRVTGSTSMTLTFPSLPTAGNAIFLKLGWVAANSNNVDVDVIDSEGNLWNRAVTSVNEFGARTAIAFLFDIPAPIGVTFSITVTRQGTIGTTMQGEAAEWSGFGTNNPLSGSHSNRAGNTSSASTGSTAVPGELDVLAFAVVQQSTVSASITVESVTPVWTQIYDGVIPGSNRGEADYRLITDGSAQNCHWTFGSNSNYSACIATFTSGQIPTAGVRGNQIVQSVVSHETNPPLRGNQFVETIVSSPPPQILLNQVVLTLVVIPSSIPPVIPATACPVEVPQPAVLPSAGCPPDLQ